MVVFAEREVHRDGLVAGAHFQFHAMVCSSSWKLLQVVRVVQVGARQRGLEPAGPGHKAIGQQGHVGVGLGAGHGVGLDAHIGVARAYAAGQGFARHKALHVVAQQTDLVVVDGAPGPGPIRPWCGGWGDESRGCGGHGAIVHKAF